MNRFRRLYGASPLHLLLASASFALTAYAGVRLFESEAMEVAVWLFGAAVLHDLVLLPLYCAADRALGAVPPRALNHVRVPAFISGLLLLVWYPLILSRSAPYASSTGLSPNVFRERWLLITAALFGASAVLLLLRQWRSGRAA
ncbi:lipoprotein [Wenjunlia tyrosinilytica]|uniref:Lipoprotein n=1 Tax=Wenjunlia tyrosinilytica TaxID=1544741 RepID=A0A918DWD8_9ACTN|nr:lipoprotein [Wenjunlia tyrosinilytica]